MDNEAMEEVLRQSKAFGVAPVAIIGDDRSRRASAARRAVWANLLTRHPGGAYPAPRLAQMFNRTPNIIRTGVKMHNEKSLSWPQNKRQSDREALTRRLESLRSQYRALKAGDAMRPALRAECARLQRQIAECQS
ncbi:hypothetical protein [EBPR siphovirus 2]|nr:hypothetical protein [EBPR siphovirus 2]